MNVAEMMKQAGALDSIARELGIDPNAAQAGAEALLPSILGGFQKQTQPDAGGLGGLIGMLGGRNLLETVVGNALTESEPGNQILGQIFGSKDVSRIVALQGAQKTGIDPSILKKMLPLLAMAVAGYLAKQHGAGAEAGGGESGGVWGQVLGGILGGSGSGASQGNPLGSLAAMLDFDGDGNPLDDILGMAGKLRS